MHHILITQVAEARRAGGTTRAALAIRAGLSEQAVRRLEKGVGSVRTLVSAMEALDFVPTGLAPGASLAGQLRATRSRRGWSLAETGDRAGLSRTTVALLERGGGSVASLLRLLAVLAPNIRRRSPERSYWGRRDKLDRDSRFTPPGFLAGIVDAFGQIDLDPCGHPLSPVAASTRILPEEGGDGLADDWSGRLAFVNPPFSQLLRWLRRAHEEWCRGHVDVVVCLVPVRTDSAWFHDTLSIDADIFLLQGRVRFLDPRGGSQHTPFSLMLVALGSTPEQRKRYAELVPGRWVPRLDAVRSNPGS